MKRKGNAVFVLSAWFTLLGILYYVGGTPLQAAEPRGTFRMAWHYNFSADYLDPSIGDPSTSRQPVLYLFHDALLKPMPDNMYGPCLAESWTISPDFRVYEFKLRKGVKFHNGDEMTAEDVVFTFQRYKGASAYLFKKRLEKLEAVSPYVFRITFKDPFPNFLEYFLPGSGTFGWIVPKKYIEKVGDEEYRKHPIGCGPYKFVEFKPGARMVGEAFEGYWRKTPKVKRMEFYFVTEKSTRLAMLQRGEVDYSLVLTDVFLEKVKKDPNLRMVYPLSTSLFTINIAAQFDKNSPWSDPRVRKAASLALDRKMLTELYAPGGKPIGCSLAFPSDPEGVYFPPDPYDPKRAKELLAEAGYPNGFNGGKFFPWGGYWDMGEQVVNYWKAIGIKMDSVLLEKAVLRNERYAGKKGRLAGSVFVEALGQPTVGTRLDLLFGPTTLGNYPEMQELWGKYQKATDPKMRKDSIGQIQKIIDDRTYLIGVFATSAPSGVSSRVKGNPCRIQEAYPLWFPSPMEDIELKQ